MKRNNEHFSVDTSTTEEERWEVVYGMDTPQGADLVINRDGNIIEVDFKVTSYPKAGTRDYEKTKQLLLEAKARHPSNLRLPNNSTTLSTILNEASGSTDSFENSPDTSRTIKLITDIFRVLANELITVANTAHKMPSSISYKQILVDKDSFDVKLLPPVEMTDVSKDETRKRFRKLGAQLLDSMHKGATTPSQQILVNNLTEDIKELFR